MLRSRTLLAALATMALASALCADGLTISLPLVGRVVGGGGVLFLTSVDVTNNASTSVPVDFYFDGTDAQNGQTVSIAGSIGDSGLVARGRGTISPMANQSFGDFVSALVDANLLSADFLNHGVTGSLLLVFNGYSKRGQGTASERFYNAFGGGTVGVSLNGHEVSQNETQRLIVTVHDTTGTTSTLSQAYPNLFINNTGLTPSGATATGPVTVAVSAVSGTTGQAIGTPITLSIGAGQTATIGHVFQALGVSPASETALIVTAAVTSGTAAIEGIVSQIDTVTRDSSAFEMSRADF
jgi:hypothetical protein